MTFVDVDYLSPELGVHHLFIVVSFNKYDFMSEHGTSYASKDMTSRTGRREVKRQGYRRYIFPMS